MSCRRQVEVRLARMAAVRTPRALPTKRLFWGLKLCASSRVRRRNADCRIMLRDWLRVRSCLICGFDDAA